VTLAICDQTAFLKLSINRSNKSLSGKEKANLAYKGLPYLKALSLPTDNFGTTTFSDARNACLACSQSEYTLL